jgi:mono/diheme cytochrome c family protein
MRRSLVLLVPLVLLLAGCGGKTVTPTPETVVGTVAAPTTTAEVGKDLPPGNAAAGKAVFASASCGACHTLAAANTNGQVGPNLDQGKFDLQRIQEQVINGGGGMPPFEGQLSNQQIADVSQFVYESTH